jgi:2-hydroxy-6-oxonona-2,4-dienedioate hydrolase
MFPVAGTALHVRTSDVAGPGAPSVVLVHGVGVSSRYMVPAGESLAGRARVFAPDLPGFGSSPKPRGVLNLPQLAGALVRWLDAASLRRVVLAANSFGCQVAVETAARWPSRISGLVLQGPTVDAEARTWPRQVGRWLANGPFEPPSLSTVIARDYLDCGTHRLVATFSIALRDRIEDKLPRIHVPALVVRGERDRIVSQGWAERVAGSLPRGRLAIIRGAAHTANFSHPTEFANLMMRFAREESLA